MCNIKIFHSKSILSSAAGRILFSKIMNLHLFMTSFPYAKLLLSQRKDRNIPGWVEASRDPASWLPSSGSYTWSSSTSHFPLAPPHWWKHGDSCPSWWAQPVLADSVPHSRAHLQPANGGKCRTGQGWVGGREGVQNGHLANHHPLGDSLSFYST